MEIFDLRYYLDLLFSPKALLQFLPALLGALVVWMVAARQAHDDLLKAKQDEPGKRVFERLAEKLTTAEQPDYIGSLRRMSAPELREATRSIAEELRLLQLRFEKERSAFSFPPVALNSQATAEQQTAAFWENTKQQSELWNRQRYQFDRDLRSRSIAIRAELARRTGIAIVTEISRNSDVAAIEDHRANSTLDTGSLAGADPLKTVADYLERLSRSL